MRERKSGRMFPPRNEKADGVNAYPSSSNGTAGTKVPAVLKAFKLLEIVSQSERPLGVSELARRLELGKSTVHGLVTTLVTLGVLETLDGSRKYVLGPQLAALSSRTKLRPDVRETARPVLERLADITEQTSFLGIPTEASVTILDLVHGRPTLSISAPVGSSIPLLAGAVGKVVLASWDPAKRAAYLGETHLPAFTAKSIVDRRTYEEAVAETISRGAAIDVDEYIEGVRAAAAPITGSGGRLLAVLWVAGFSRHIDSARLDFIAEHVAREGALASRQLTRN
jgi:IclR family KDG regulon transcriptional repressor